ncbi:hypothetical protein GGG87_09050 [Streptococcus sp. zg-86]|uniref:Uncharacterized protein n=1 Tax=Streptococcus zhangguiae TaxID=2664091 RepID=A0A6I4REF2_9STRE|nr:MULTISPECIES: DUF6625 family protein [unclassified Streptococcus]MTB65140.1 hypothetical protein [Streptococcus sp. zg-86]MTB91400.1 hypothetical protein [Streptococcus sp. zg-36]MWV57128.1 hypothetical protein [Streptococcus sp. zg-70]QTH47136.1 hypothetical protein J5M87_06100 [Streptococcus sp. zg-86]
MRKNSIALIVPFFGPLPEYTKLFFYTLGYHKEITVLLFTDQQVEKVPENVKVTHTSFEQFKKRLEHLFEFEISLEKSYKLCDFRPAYGLLLEKELQNYDFWGYCDLDIIVGDISGFLQPNILENYDKIYQHGHLTLFRNTPENNRRFMEKAGMDYRECFTSPINAIFDEVLGIQRKYELLGISTYISRDCADISPWHYSFRRVESHLKDNEMKSLNYNLQVFFWEKGKVYRAYWNEELFTVEYDQFNYLHFQKRNLSLSFLEGKIEKLDSFYICRDGFQPKKVGFNVTLDEIRSLNGHNRFKDLQKRWEYKLFMWKRRFSKYLLKK